MATDLQTSPRTQRALPPVPWRDPHTVSPEKLLDYIRALEQACVENPDSADIRTCLGMAYAMNYDAYKSMDALEAACEINPNSFWARFKYAELHYRLRALRKSEEETLRALDLATNSFEVALSRKQLLEIRRLMREGTVKPALTRSLAVPALVLAVMSITVCLMAAFR
jgi:tetratricopeptide (TPR) repeat protein